MQIIHVAAECAPLVKVGGLADMLFGLTRQLSKLGHDVEIILPYYTLLNKADIRSLELFANHFHRHRIWQGKMDAITITLIEPLDHDYFTRSKVYGESDDGIRFATFSQIAHLYLCQKKAPFLVHLHDWHTALIPLLNQQKLYPTLFTIHNFAYQGECDPEILLSLHVPLPLLESIREGKNCNLMKAALLYADQLTTVSKSYAEEITYTAQGGSLQKILLHFQGKMKGIINGIDKVFWNPESDPYLPYPFSKDRLENKERLKKEIIARFRLRSEKDFLACSITRLVPQKGPFLILEAIREIIRMGGAYLLVGSAFDPNIEQEFLALQQTLATPEALHLELIYNEEISHLVYAASDLFVMPSIFEPCGLTQLIALRYGTLPLVRETGGLKDTIFEGKNGFTFKEAEKEDLRNALARAMTLWSKEPDKWKKLQQEAMKEDHGWEQSAQKYLDLYKKISSHTTNSF